MTVTITVRKDGSYRVEGDFTLLDHDGNVIPTTPGKPVSLCRCGGSTRKPFCDGTHSKIGFRGAEEAVRASEAPPVTVNPPESR
jgi:CDGSH-type Zn-finger protein